MNVQTNNGLDVWPGKQFETNKVSNYSTIMIIRISSVNYNEIVNGRNHNKPCSNTNVWLGFTFTHSFILG